MEALRRHAITIRRLLHPPEESLPHGCSSGVLEGYLSPDYPGKENSFPFYRDSKNYSEQSGARAMNCHTCQLKELELEPPEIKDVLRCILHTIFLHRTLSLVRPKDVDCHLLEITYVQCGLAELEKEVDEKINQFIAWVEKHPNRKSQVCLSFFEEKNKHPGWFSNKTERMYWEQWFINLHVISPKGHGKSHSSRAPKNIGGQAWEETSARRAALKLLIHEVLFQIIDFANEEKDHIPLISDRIFNHEILIPSSSDSVFGWNTDVLRRVLNSGHPYALS